MIKSMTGFGRGHFLADGVDILAEVRSVNHRFLECTIRLPRAYGFLEERVKKCVQQVAARGKVEVNLTIQLPVSAVSTVSVNLDMANAYCTALREANETLQLQDDVTLSTLLHLPDVCTVQKLEMEEDVIWRDTEVALQEALQHFITMRQLEGEKLQQDVQFRLQKIAENLAKIEAEAPVMQQKYYDRLYQKLAVLLENQCIDTQRLVTEAAVFAEKVAIDEETVRLHSHLQQCEQLLSSEEPVGRKLDFLVQEMNREVNTIGSKAQNLDITKLVVEMKSEIEKIREQIQNME
ncbi:MAG: YicC/YloC family endoribonuclease [Oscillospiraceae bacterium]|nr:YicC/YloC family endoribonuclease [Oscillospiraceae bacterium]